LNVSGAAGGANTLILGTSTLSFLVGVNSNKLTIKGAQPSTFSGLAGLQLERLCP